MKELIIVGAGGFGRELLQWAKDINKVNNRWLIKGFIDDDINAINGYKCSHNVIGTIKGWVPSKKEVFACAIANPKTKEQIITDLKAKGALFTDLIHPTALIGEHNMIGEALIMYPYARITTNTIIGDYVTLLSSVVGHDAQIGDYTTISSHCGINGKVKLGKRVFLGSHATIIPEKNIGDDAYIAAGSVVFNNVKQERKVMGNPAKKFTL